MWKYLNESIEGTSHRASGIACQDSSFVSPCRVEGEDILILVCADGAGSAAQSQIGSKLACEVVVREVLAFFGSGKTPAQIEKDLPLEWAHQVRHAIDEEAKRRSTSPRELACTLLFAVLGKTTAVFGQIGDGAIVIARAGGMRAVFWPQSGEYHNTTYFITDEQYEQRFQVEVVQQSVDEIAIFTDGLEMLALEYSGRTVHEPFFSPMFASLRVAVDSHDLIIPMRQFLASKAVNDRTDDDKTLILASRVASADAIV